MSMLSLGIYVCTGCRGVALDPRRFMPLRRSVTVHPVLDGCRACGHDSYSPANNMPGLHTCDNCSVLFVDPEKFMRRTALQGAGAILQQPLPD